jgi:two-component system phosphate regulon sensor histidine kinase PhoR
VRKSYLWISVFVMSGAVSAVAVLLTLLSPGRPAIAVAGGVGLSLVSALLVRWTLRRDMERLRCGLRLLPEFDGGLRGLPGDFEETVQELERASAGVRRGLALAEEERRQLEAVLDAMEDAVVAVDSAGRIQWTNLKMRKMIVVPGGGVRGAVRVGHALVQTIRDPEVLECVRLALEERTAQVKRTTTALPGRTYEINASPMPGGGAVAVLHDVTRVEEMERTQRDFVANVSHELRTPLTSILGYVETLLDHEKGISVPAREFLGTIYKNATRMTRLTEDLLVMARVEASSVQLNPAPVPADVLIHDALAAMSGLVQENEALLDTGETTDCQVFADTDAVMQILSNLIENAIKYGKGRGGAAARVVVSAREIHDPYDAVEFQVKDFGMGIASEHLGRIFERFYRVDKTRSRESGGTGLGLSIVRHMVQVQAGSIRAESELGSGSTFSFTLPKALYPVVYERTLQ